ncbi:amidohydrolase family protein [Cyclobacterium plantarum]|uniref:Amidohydrolase family protein n=1 Tax=Cyclobacterium plantarum TaxID=2716263 RepID=A0ABX0H8B6_9BACT|nr:amidohydrolase family protein [Cyclobacterium plantarum]NHE58101.1 amidohydrolase family protein [Cyclobacterium plantarum]
MKIYPLICLSLLCLLACKNEIHEETAFTAFSGARIIDGSGATPIEDGVILVQEDHIIAIGSREEVEIPEHSHVIDLTGKTIIPGLINGHGHVGDVKGISGGHYSAENLAENLSIYATYGITTVVSLGGDQEEAVSFRHLNDKNPQNRSRLFIAGAVITGDTPAEAEKMIEENHEMGVDFMKIRVDDNLGNATKMPEEVYRAVIGRSHELGYKIATHSYYLEDSRKLLEAGSDLLAHSVRDLPVDESFVQLIKEKNVGYCPTLTRELSTYVYEDTAAFFSDPFFQKVYDKETIQPLLDPERQANVAANSNAQTYKKQLPVAYANLKSLNDAGVPIVFGTDSGVPTRFMGYFEHLEMEMMAEAGMSPMEILVSATKNVAEYLELEGLGTLAPGHYADFIILDANPLEDIRNTREINEIYIGGNKVVERDK